MSAGEYQQTNHKSHSTKFLSRIIPFFSYYLKPWLRYSSIGLSSTLPTVLRQIVIAIMPLKNHNCQMGFGKKCYQTKIPSSKSVLGNFVIATNRSLANSSLATPSLQIRHQQFFPSEVRLSFRFSYFTDYRPFGITIPQNLHLRLMLSCIWSV